MLSSMENFTIKEQIGKGAQATVYIVERQQDNAKCILKKVECYDECEANKAFKEATALQDLQHVYVSGYKEFFVLWEKEDSSVYICIVMDYFPHGTLQNILDKAREKKEVISEQLIKQWMGQIIEALVYVHKKKIIHRDVRPSNIYIKEDGNLALGDFGVATIMGDAVTCTRACPSSLNYMAPDVITKGYTESSDVWALGCVLFELVTTSLYDGEEAIKKFAEIKENREELDIVFDKICSHYSDSLITVLGMMMHNTKRPTALGLLNNNFIRSCVELSDATQVEKRKRLKSASTARTEITEKDSSEGHWPVPKNQGLLRVIEYLAHMIDYENSVRETLEYLLDLTKSDAGLHLDPKGKKLVAMAMKNNLPDKYIQIYGCKVLNSLIITALEKGADSDDVLFSPEVIAVIPLAMENHKDDPEVQLAAASLLMAMAANGAAGSVIGHLGGVHDVLIALRTHPNDPLLCSTSLNAFWELTVHGNNIKIATDEKGIRDVCTVFKLHLRSAPVAEAACAAILALSLDEENLELISELDGVGLLIDAITQHTKNFKVVKNACLALASLVEIDEESAYRVLTNEGPDNTHIAGVPILVKTYELHRDNAAVVESIVTLLMELAEYDDLRAEMDHWNVGPGLLSEIFKRFKDNVDIMGPCEKALEKLRAVKRPVVPPTPSPDLKEEQAPQVALQA